MKKLKRILAIIIMVVIANQATAKDMWSLPDWDTPAPKCCICGSYNCPGHDINKK